MTPLSNKPYSEMDCFDRFHYHNMIAILIGLTVSAVAIGLMYTLH